MLINGFVTGCRRFGRRCRVTWFRTLSWKVTPVWSEDTSVDFIDELFKFIDFFTFQVPDANACSSFLPSHSREYTIGHRSCAGGSFGGSCTRVRSVCECLCEC